MSGRQLGNYVLEDKLGEGGMGVVYTATDGRLRRKVVVKMLHKHMASNRVIAKRFQNEATAAAGIGHPGIVEIYDTGYADDGALYIVMELLRGQSLQQRLDDKTKLSPAKAVAIIRQCASALSAAHASGIVHRDLKPDNIFLEVDPAVVGGERAKLLDFGIAKLSAATGASAMTGLGQVMGTAYYMSPEQCKDAAGVDHRTDLYALGCILFQMLTGRLPFQGASNNELIIAHVVQPPPTLRSVAPQLSPQLEELVSTLLSKEPVDRFASADALIGALDQLPSSATGAPGQSPASEGVDPPVPLAPTEMPDAPVPLAPTDRGDAPVPIARTEIGGAPAPLAPTKMGAAPPPPARDQHQEAPRDVKPSPSTTLGSSTTAKTIEQRKSATGLMAAFGVLIGVTTIVFFVVGDRASKNQSDNSDSAQIMTENEQGLNPSAAPGLNDDPGAQENRWISISVGGEGTAILGAPQRDYQIMQHEVTWSEIADWLEPRADLKFDLPSWLPKRPELRRTLPVTGIPHETARAYCEHLDAALPTDLQWEYAARGQEQRRLPWGEDAINLNLTHVFQGGGPMVPVMSSTQDKTPGPAALSVFDMLGNAQEWTSQPTGASVPVGPTRLAVLDIQREKVPALMADKVESMLSESLQGLGVEAIGRKEIRSMLAGSEVDIATCRYGPCLSRFYEATKIPFALVLIISKTASGYSFSATVSSTKDGSSLSQTIQNCNTCDTKELETVLTMATMSLIPSLAEHGLDETDVDRYVRGLPISGAVSSEILDQGLSYRSLACQGGSCPKGATKLEHIGFRCVRESQRDTQSQPN